jgi:beta-glucanase (GH16 family)
MKLPAKLFVLLSCFVSVNAYSQSVDPYLPDNGAPPVYAGMKLVWNDEFDVDGAPNSANWKPETGFVRNQELQYYQLANAKCKGGVLLFTGKRDTVVNAKYVKGSTDWRYKDSLAYWTSASLISQGLKYFKNGRIEVRARIDTTYGVWPAIWQKGVTGSWPSCGEVDMMEYYKFKIYANAIYGTPASPNYSKCKSASLSTITGSDNDWVKKFHVWTEVWTTDSLKLYLDGNLMNGQLIVNLANPAGTTPANGFQQAHFFLLNLAIGANGGTPAASTASYTYEVDYIRVYQDATTGIDNVAGNTVRIVPNPVSGAARIVSEQNPVRIVISDMLGRTIMQADHPSGSLNLSALSQGTYVARISFADGKPVVVKFIKK